MANNDQNDKELNDYLNGDSDVSKLYRASNSNKPPSKLDDAILSAAKKTANNVTQKTKYSFHKSSWTVPISIAAMVTLSVSLVVTMQQEAGLPLISEPDVEMFDSAATVEKTKVSEAVINSDDAPVMGDVDIKKNKDERVDITMPEAATLGAAANIYRAEEKTEIPKAKMKRLSEKRMLLKERVQQQTETIEERDFSNDGIIEAESAVVEFYDVMDMKQNRKFSIQEKVLLEIKVMWEEGKVLEAKQVYDDFTKNYSGMTVDSIKEILGDNVYNGLIRG